MSSPLSGSRWLWWLGATAVFVGYFMVWLPGPSAGLQLMGLEMGEWVKFLGVGGQRDWFYVPPITLGLLLAWQTAVWPNRRWQTWAMRALAVLVALVAFPAVEDLLGPSRSQYLLRVALIGLVGLAALAASVLAGRGLRADSAYWTLMVVLALVGLSGPLQQYLALRPFLAEALQQPLGIGPGLWLNTAGYFLLLWVALRRLVAVNRATKNGQPPATRAAR